MMLQQLIVNWMKMLNYHYSLAWASAEIFPGEQRQHVAILSQVDDDAIKIYVRETLYPYYTTTPQRNCPMLQQRSQKCTLLAAMTRYIPIIFTIGYLHIFKAGHLFLQKYCHGPLTNPQIILFYLARLVSCVATGVSLFNIRLWPSSTSDFYVTV